MRVRLRKAHSAALLAEMYAKPHDHRIYGRGHHERVESTIALALSTIEPRERRVVADLSCGNGEIARRLEPEVMYLGDIAVLPAELDGPQTVKCHGPVEDTVHDLPMVDVFVCSETIEHLDDPGKVLALARSKADWLVLSTPLECWDDSNAEHYWSWDREGVEDLLKRCGWAPRTFDSVDSREWGEPYLFGIWVAR